MPAVTKRYVFLYTNNKRIVRTVSNQSLEYISFEILERQTNTKMLIIWDSTQNYSKGSW